MAKLVCFRDDPIQFINGRGPRFACSDDGPLLRRDSQQIRWQDTPSLARRPCSVPLPRAGADKCRPFSACRSGNDPGEAGPALQRQTVRLGVSVSQAARCSIFLEELTTNGNLTVTPTANSRPLPAKLSAILASMARSASRVSA
jgi:hypothetical protein